MRDIGNARNVRSVAIQCHYCFIVAERLARGAARAPDMCHHGGK